MNKEERLLTPKQRVGWRILQAVVWLVGVAIVGALLWKPKIGIDAFWNVLIPVAPALLVLAPGIWRNICPLGMTSLIPRRFGFSKGRKLSVATQAVFATTGVLLLLLIVPLRHVIFDLNGPATAKLLLSMAGIAFLMGVFFEGKSGWCSGICPVHPVEKLYGQAPLFSPPNAQCDRCTKCVQPCPESIPNGHPLSVEIPLSRVFPGMLLVGGFPGFVYGWFQVQDQAKLRDGLGQLAEAYSWPLGGLLVTFLLFVILQKVLPRKDHPFLIRLFGAAAVSCYYWFRLPALFGYGPFPGDGMLVDMTATLPGWFPIACQLFTTTAFLYLLVFRHKPQAIWTHPPAFATDP